MQAPEDGTDVVTAAKRVITEPGLNTLGLKDKRDITRLVAQSALQVCATILITACMASLCTAAAKSAPGLAYSHSQADSTSAAVNRTSSMNWLLTVLGYSRSAVSGCAVPSLDHSS